MNLKILAPLFFLLSLGGLEPVMAQASTAAGAGVQLAGIYNAAAQNGILTKSVPEKVEYFSSLFLGRPYLGGALGEGFNAQFDNDPLYRFDAFDCTTFVETVMALSLSSSSQQFPQVMNLIRYRDGQIGLFTRNHFTSSDWIPNAERFGVLRDVTASISGDKVSILTTLIEKQSWYEKQAPSMVKSPGNLDGKISYIRERAKELSDSLVQLAYIDKTVFLTNTHLLRFFPKAGVINIVRSNWNVRDAIGTALDISHQGIIFERNGEIIFRHASFKRGSQYVVEIPLVEYVRRNFDDKTFAGVNVLSFMEN